MDAAQSLKTVKRFHKHKSIMNYLVSLIHQYVGDPRKKLKHENSRLSAYIQGLIRCLLGSTNTFSAYLFVLYLFIKLLYIVNSLVQLYAIRLLLEQKWTVNETINGLRQIFTSDILRANPLSKYFPKISMCDFRIIEPNSDEGHKYTVQCEYQIRTRLHAYSFDMERSNLHPKLFSDVDDLLSENSRLLIRRRV